MPEMQQTSSFQASPTIAEFLPKYRKDDNEWWRLESGDMQNLFDEAIDTIDRLKHGLEHASHCERCERCANRAKGLLNG